MGSKRPATLEAAPPVKQHRFRHVVGFDDAPFDRAHRGDVMIVGAVFSGPTLQGVLSSKLRRDGANATRVITETLRNSRFFPQLHAVLLQGIAFAGFNVVDIRTLHRELALPVIVVTRRAPDMDTIRRALLEHVPGGRRKWQLIEQAGSTEHIDGLYVQRQGLSYEDTHRMLQGLALNSRVPEPLRVAHLIAGGIGRGESRGRA